MPDAKYKWWVSHPLMLDQANVYLVRYTWLRHAVQHGDFDGTEIFDEEVGGYTREGVGEWQQHYFHDGEWHEYPAFGEIEPMASISGQELVTCESAKLAAIEHGVALGIKLAMEKL